VDCSCQGFPLPKDGNRTSFWILYFWWWNNVQGNEIVVMYLHPKQSGMNSVCHVHWIYWLARLSKHDYCLSFIKFYHVGKGNFESITTLVAGGWIWTQSNSVHIWKISHLDSWITSLELKMEVASSSAASINTVSHPRWWQSWLTCSFFALQFTYLYHARFFLPHIINWWDNMKMGMEGKKL
jgi:hypothetical protein